MRNRKSLQEAQVAIVGLGLMGGSMAMALQHRCASLVGCDADREVLRQAKQAGLIDRTETQLDRILPGTDLLILATPVCSILDILRSLPANPPNPLVVMDVGSTKSDIVDRMSDLPSMYDPIGGHPLCGKEISGLNQASADLYQDAPFVLTPLPRTTQNARSMAAEIVEAINARLLWLNPEDHDIWVATTSHLPYLLAISLIAVTQPEAFQVIGPGFRGATRLAGANPRMMTDIFVTNREPVLQAIENFSQQLDTLHALIEQGEPEPLEQCFNRSAQQRSRVNPTVERE